MVNDAKEAVLHYLEFHLIKMVEDMERHINDPDVIGGMYDRAYNILKDLEFTIDTQQLLDGPNCSTKRIS